MKVIKRDGSSVDYDRSKIVIAIEKANAEVSEEDRLAREDIDAIIGGTYEDTGEDPVNPDIMTDLVNSAFANV